MNKDKIIVAFLVSAGLFSLVQAQHYVKGLSSKNKSALASVAKMPLQMVSAAMDPYETQEPKKQRNA